MVPVSELRVTISQMLKEVLDGHKARTDGMNEKGRVENCLLVDFVTETTGPLAPVSAPV